MKGMGRANIFDVLYAYMERAISSLPERGSRIREGAEGLNFHLSRNYASWMKKQGYMAIHPFASEDMRLVMCARGFFHSDSICWSNHPQNSADCKEKFHQRFYNTLAYMTSQGIPGWTGPLGERMECAAPCEVDEDGHGKGPFHFMNEFYPDIGDRNVHGRPAEIADIHTCWIEWGKANKFDMTNFTGLTGQVFCGNEIVNQKGKLHARKTKWNFTINELIPACATGFAKVRDGHRFIMGLGNEECWKMQIIGGVSLTIKLGRSRAFTLSMEFL